MEASPSVPPSPAATDGGAHQNLVRTCLMLDVLARASASGLRLADAVRETGLSKTATHRLLAGLVAHGLADYDEATSRYLLGDRVFEWSSRASGRFELAHRARAPVQRLAERTGDTAYLLMRSRDDAVCFARAEGTYPVRTVNWELGERRPLGMGAGSLAILAWTAPQEAEAILQRNAPALEARGVTVDSVRKLVAAARRNGYAMHLGQVIDGMGAIGLPILDAAGRPLAALSVAAVTARLMPPRRAEIVEILAAECRRVGEELRTVLSVSNPGEPARQAA